MLLVGVELLEGGDSLGHQVGGLRRGVRRSVVRYFLDRECQRLQLSSERKHVFQRLAEKRLGCVERRNSLIPADRTVDNDLLLEDLAVQ